MNTSKTLRSLAAMATLALAGAAPSYAACTDCGTVTAINKVEKEGEGTGLGAVAGGVAGAVVGNQFGKGTGNTAMTVIGAGGGAYAGHQVEKHMKKKTFWNVQVKFDKGGDEKTYSFPTEPNLRKGDRVQLKEGKPVLLR
jgi:outer membrane lipoprotein SlyB